MQFIDQAEVFVAGGNGGDGIVAFRREKYVPAGGPSGGNGGRGGSVVFKAVENLQTLLDFRYAHRFQAEHGERGGPSNRTGASGEDLLVEVPCGTVVYDAETDEVVGDLTEPEQAGSAPAVDRRRPGHSARHGHPGGRHHHGPQGSLSPTSSELGAIALKGHGRHKTRGHCWRLCL